MKIYITILKPRLSLLVLVTAYLGFYLGIRSQGEYVFSYDELYLLFYLLLGTFLSSSGSIVLNQVIEKKHDAKMQRTKNRPIPTGKMSSLTATIYGFSLIISGVIPLLMRSNADGYVLVPCSFELIVQRMLRRPHFKSSSFLTP